MIARYNRMSFLFGLPGLVLQGIGFSSRSQNAPVLQLAGFVLLIIGLAYYAKAKGRTGLWGLLGVFSLLGFIVLGVLPDRARSGKVTPARGWAVASAQRNQAPAIDPQQPLMLSAPIQVAPSVDDIGIQRDGRMIAVFPRHATDFLEAVAAATRPFTATEALVWEPGYDPADVIAVLSVLVKLDVLRTA